jgi:hypothetical protein
LSSEPPGSLAAAAARDAKRIKVFRHVLRRTDLPPHSEQPSRSPAAAATVAVDRRPSAAISPPDLLLRKEMSTPSSSLSFQLYSHANAPLSLSLRGGKLGGGGGGDMLPADYREPVATLPPIQNPAAAVGTRGPLGGGAVGPDLIDMVGFPLARERSGGGGGGHQRSALDGDNAQQDSYA